MQIWFNYFRQADNDPLLPRSSLEDWFNYRLTCARKSYGAGNLNVVFAVILDRIWWNRNELFSKPSFLIKIVPFFKFTTLLKTLRGLKRRNCYYNRYHNGQFLCDFAGKMDRYSVVQAVNYGLCIWGR